MKIKPLFIYVLLIIALMAHACSKENDDTELKDQNKNEQENLCKEINSNIYSLKIIVNAYINQNCVSNITSFSQDGKQIGYTIQFSEGSLITVYCRGNSDSGTPPTIGVMKDIDDYYWTLNNTWLLNDEKKRIKVTDITPQLSIESDYWKISYNNGETWNKLDKVSNTTYSIFNDITEDKNYVYIALANGTSLPLPKNKPLSITLSETEDIRVVPNETYNITYTLTGTDKDTEIRAIAQDGFHVTIKKTSETLGIIEIVTPNTVTNSKISIFVTDGKGKTITRSINFVEGVIYISTTSYTTEQSGGKIDVQLSTNIDFTVNIPLDARHWISIAPISRVSMRDEILSFIVEPNKGTSRHTTIKLVDVLGQITETIYIFQQGQEGDSQVHHVTTPGTLAQLISNEAMLIIKELKITGKMNEDDFAYIRKFPELKKLDLVDLENTEIPTQAFANTEISTILLPSQLKIIPAYAFSGSSITSIDIPLTVEKIMNMAFYETTNLNGDVTIPDATTLIDNFAFSKSNFDGKLTFGKGLKEIGVEAFSLCTKITGDLILPNSIETIGDSAFCYAYSSFNRAKTTAILEIGSGITKIPKKAFRGCHFKTLILGKNVTIIEEEAFRDSWITDDLVLDNVETIRDNAFYNYRDPERGTGKQSHLILGKNLLRIGATAFGKTDFFDHVYCKAMIPPQIERNTFGYGSHGLLVIPTGTRLQYRRTDWNMFGHNKIVEMDF